MNSLRKTLGKQKRALIRVLHGKEQKYQSYNRLIRHFVPQANPVIFDVGAHNGESIERFKEAYPACDIHSFEADKENFDKLQTMFGKKPAYISITLLPAARKKRKYFTATLKATRRPSTRSM